MGIVNLVINHLAGSNDIKKLVSSRIRPIILDPKDALPAITVTQSNFKKIKALDCDTGIVSSQIGIDILAEKYATALQLMELVIDRVDGIGRTSDGTYQIEDMQLDESDDIERTIEIVSDGNTKYLVQMNFSVDAIKV